MLGLGKRIATWVYMVAIRVSTRTTYTYIMWYYVCTYLN